MIDPTIPVCPIPVTVTSVHDADTLKAIVHLPFGIDLREHSYRAKGYDAWESNYVRKDVTITPDEIIKGQKARDELIALLTQGQMYFEGQDIVQTYDRIVSTWWMKVNTLWIYMPKYAEDHGWLRTQRI